MKIGCVDRAFRRGFDLLMSGLATIGFPFLVLPDSLLPSSRFPMWTRCKKTRLRAPLLALEAGRYQSRFTLCCTSAPLSRSALQPEFFIVGRRPGGPSAPVPGSLGSVPAVIPESDVKTTRTKLANRTPEINPKAYLER